MDAIWKFRTGVPIVDACMKELIASGYITNRARQILANYITMELDIDWRLGLTLFKETMIDFHFE